MTLMVFGRNGDYSSGLNLKIPDPLKMVGRVVDGLGNPLDNGPELIKEIDSGNKRGRFKPADSSKD